MEVFDELMQLILMVYRLGKSLNSAGEYELNVFQNLIQYLIRACQEIVKMIRYSSCLD